MWILLVSVALATPARCVAAWTGPAEEACLLRGTYEGSATAPNEKRARADAIAHLREVLRLAAEARLVTSPDSSVADYALCGQEAEESAFVNCFPAPELVGPRRCFARLDDPACWDGQVMSFTSSGIGALEKGRALMCEAVHQRVSLSGYSDIERRKAYCAASCEKDTVVSCPGQ